MTLLTSMGGTLYDVPADQLAQYEADEETVGRILAAMDAEEACDPGPPAVSGDAPQVVIHISDSGDAFDPGPPEGCGYL